MVRLCYRLCSLWRGRERETLGPFVPAHTHTHTPPSQTPQSKKIATLSCSAHPNVEPNHPVLIASLYSTLMAPASGLRQHRMGPRSPIRILLYVYCKKKKGRPREGAMSKVDLSNRGGVGGDGRLGSTYGGKSASHNSLFYVLCRLTERERDIFQISIIIHTVYCTKVLCCERTILCRRYAQSPIDVGLVSSCWFLLLPGVAWVVSKGLAFVRHVKHYRHSSVTESLQNVSVYVGGVMLFIFMLLLATWPSS